jgi:hypothetical protein
MTDFHVPTKLSRNEETGTSLSDDQESDLQIGRRDRETFIDVF